jgi:deoxycytidine triphosphate deaminase
MRVSHGLETRISLSLLAERVYFSIVPNMAKVLSDKDIKKLLSSVIADGDSKLVNPNGIELRLGKHVRFLSTGEDKELDRGQFLRVSPGETVLISSYERVDFSAETVKKHFAGCMLMGWISPTTTMMREGISQVTTKIDAGFRGILNWSLRNSSTKDLILQFGEPIYKLTIYLLDQNEAPEVPYGGNPEHHYQDTEGILRSARKIPSDIPKSKLICSSFEKLDPQKQLKEAGYPFNHIATELTELHGKFEVVSSDVRLLKDQFQKQTTELSAKIETETGVLAKKLDDTKSNLLDKFGEMFSKRFLKATGVIVGSIPIMYGGLNFLQKSKLADAGVAFVAIGVGVVIWICTAIITRK